jgi:hypothetical protein
VEFLAEICLSAKSPAFIDSRIKKHANRQFFIEGELGGHVFEVGVGIEPAPWGD